MSVNPSRRKILIVDDDEELSSLLEIIFDGEGLEVITAANGQEALAFLETAPENPNLILSDMTMPIMGGAELLTKLRSNVKTENIPIILSSAVQDSQVLSQALGASACLAKPYDLEKLISLVNAHLN